MFQSGFGGFRERLFKGSLEGFFGGSLREGLFHKSSLQAKSLGFWGLRRAGFVRLCRVRGG